MVTLVGLGSVAVALASDHLLGHRIGAAPACVGVLSLGALVLVGWSALRSHAAHLIDG